MNRQRKDLLGFLVGVFFCLVLNLFDQPGSVVTCLALHRYNQLLLGLFRAQARNFLQLDALLCNQRLDLIGSLLKVAITIQQGLLTTSQVLITGFNLGDLAIKVLFFLHQPFLLGLKLLA